MDEVCESVEKGNSSTVLSTPPTEIFSLVEPPEWCNQRHLAAALVLAAGGTQEEAAKAAGRHVNTIRKWLNHPERGASFEELINRLTLHVDLAHRGTRLRRAMRLAKSRYEAELQEPAKRHTWLDYARFIREEVAPVAVAPMSPAVQIVQQFISQSNTVNLGGVGEPTGEIVEGKVKQLEEVQ